MLPTFAAAENVSVEDVTDVTTVLEADTPASAEPITIAPAETVASEPVAALQDDDAAHVAAGEFMKTVAPNGTIQYFNSLSGAMAVANGWTEGGGVVYLLTDYTAINPDESTAYLMPGGNPTYTTTDEDGLTVYGYWIDLGGHTLTARVAQVVFGRAGAGSVNIRNGRVIYQNYGRGSAQIGVVTYGYSSTSPVSGSTILKTRTTVKNAEIVSLKTLKNSSVNCVTSTLGDNEVNVYDSKLVAVSVPAVKFQKSSAAVTGAGLAALQSEGLHSSVMLHGKSVVGTLADNSAVYYTGSSGTSTGITHTVTVDAEQDSIFLGNGIFTSGSSIPLTTTTPAAMMSAGKYSYALPDESTIVEASTVGAKPSYLEAQEYNCFRYPPFKTDAEMIEEGSFIKTVSPSGITIGYNNLQAAFTAAGSWKEPGGKITLLQDYTEISKMTTSSFGLLTAPSETYLNDEDPDLTVEGLWFDLNGHTLTVTAARPLIYSGMTSRINIKNGSIIYRNSGRTDAYYGAISVGVASPTLIAGGKVNDVVVNMKDVNFYAMRWSAAGANVNRVTPVFSTTLWKTEINLYNSTAISEDAQAIEFNKANKTLSEADKAIMLAADLGYSVNLHGSSVLGSLADYTAITLNDIAKIDSGMEFDCKVVMSENARVLGKDLLSGGLSSKIVDSITTESGEALNLGPATYMLSMPDGSTFATTSTAGAKPAYLEATSKAALIHTPLVETEGIASFTSADGVEGAATTLSKAFAAWKQAGYRGTVKLLAEPAKDDIAGAAVEVGGNYSYATTTTTNLRKKSDVILTSAANGGDLTLDLNGYAVSTADIFLAADPDLNDFELNIRNGKITSASDAALILNGAKFGVTLENVELTAAAAKGYCIYDYRVDHSYLIADRCEMTADQGKAIYVLTNSTNKNDTSLLYYIKDLVYTDSASTNAPIAQGTNSGSVHRKRTVIFDGDSDAYGTSMKSFLTTEDAAAAVLTVKGMTFNFAQAIDAITYAVYFGRSFEDVTVTMKKDAVFNTKQTVDNAGYASAFALDFDGHAFSGNGTDAILALNGTTDITIRNAAISNGTAPILTGANSYTYENCSINSAHVFTRVSNQASENDAATYTAAVTGEEIFFTAAVDAIIYSQCDTNATAAVGGTVKLLADSTADASVNYNADDVCVIRLSKDAKALHVDLNGHVFKIPGALAIGGNEAFSDTLSVTVSNGTWEQTKAAASAFRIDGNAPLFNLQLENVTLRSSGSGISYFAADSADNTVSIKNSTIIANNNGIETLNGAMEGRIGGSVLVENSAIAAVNRQAGYAIVEGTSAADAPSHILLVGGDVVLYSAMNGQKPVKVSSVEGNFCVAPQYKAVFEEERSQPFIDDSIKEEIGVAVTLGGKEYEALTSWTPNTIAYYVTKDNKLTSFSTTDDLLAAYQADAAGEGTITLITDVTFPATINVDKDLTIQLSGKTLTAAETDAIHVAAGKTLNILNGMVKSGAAAVVNEGTLTVTDAKLVGADALKIAGEAPATAQLENSALYALSAGGYALDASGAAGSVVTLTSTIVVAPYTEAALKIADGNTVEFITVPEIYAKPDRTATGFEVADGGALVVPDDLVVTMLLQKTSIDYPEANGLKYSVSCFGFRTINVSFKQDGSTLHTETLFSGTASSYAEQPAKISFNNSTFVFIGWKIDGADETLYQIGALPLLFDDTVFIAVFEETQNIATVTLNNETKFYNDLTSAMAAVTAGAELKIWRDLTLEQPLTITKSDFTFNLGGATISAENASAAIVLMANNITLKNGMIVNSGNALESGSCTGTKLVDLKLKSDAIALRANGGEMQISTSLLVGTDEALYAENAVEIVANSTEFYSTNSYALTVTDAGTKLILDGGNRIGSTLNGQVVLRLMNGATIDTVSDTFFVTKALRETGTWYECDATSQFILQSVFPERNATFVKIANEANGYSDTAEFYAVTSESAAATVNGVSYNTLISALSAAGKLDGATVVLLRDIVSADETTSAYSFTKDMTLDLNGHVLVARTSGQAFSISSSRTVTIKNGTLIAPASGDYNFMGSTGCTLNLENVNYFAKSSKHNIYASTSTVDFTINIVGGVIVNYGSGYPVYLNFDGSTHSAFVSISDGTVFINASNKASLAKRNSGTEFMLNIQDAYTYGPADADHFASVPENYTNPDLSGSDDGGEEEEDEGIIFQNVIPEPVVLDEAANPQAFLNQKFADLTVKYAQYLPSFSSIPTSSVLLHHINQNGVAEVEGASYGSVADALAVAGRSEDANVSVKLLKDSVESGISTVPANVTLDLNGKTLSFSGNADMTVNGEIMLNGGKLEAEGNVLFKAGSKDLNGETVTQEFRLDQRLTPVLVSLTLNNGVCVNFKTKLGALDSFASVRINGQLAEKAETRTTSIYSHTFDFDSFAAEVELTALDAAGTIYRSGYKTGVKAFADAIADNATSAANFRTAMRTLSQFGAALSAAHDWTKAADLAATGCAVYVDTNKSFDLKLTGGTAGAKATVSYTDSTCNQTRSMEVTFSDAGEAVFEGLYAACLNDLITVSCDGRSDAFTYADMVKNAYGETALYNAMVAYSNAANALFKS
ncbi:MAG: hypothetical protein IKC04_01040 [Oscillospiraceae bacterium]|nr:hypothetical protein [Oscillospiraceae bacterium]